MISKYANIYIFTLSDYKYKMLSPAFTTTFIFVCYKMQNRKIAQICNIRGNIFISN